MAAAAVEGHPLDNLDVHGSRAAREVRRAQRPPKYSSRNGHASPPQGQGQQRYTLEDEPYISPESDTEMQGQDDTPASPSRRSPPRQKPPVAPKEPWAPPSPNSRPSSFSGPAGDDARRQSAATAASSGGRYRRHDRPNGRPASGEQQQPPQQPQPPSTFSPSGAWARSGHQQEPPAAKRSSHQSRRSQPPPESRHGAAPEASGPAAAQLNRLGSPSIPETVLGPLMQKITEYDGLMKETQRERDQLEDELRALHERLRQAEERYAEAETKRNEYRRQYEDVDRALKGEFAPSHQLQAPSHQAVQAQMMAQAMPPQALHRPGTMESYEHRPTSNPVSKQSSRTVKLGTRDRIKLSLFGTT